MTKANTLTLPLAPTSQTPQKNKKNVFNKNIKYLPMLQKTIPLTKYVGACALQGESSQKSPCLLVHVMSMLRTFEGIVGAHAEATLLLWLEEFNHWEF